MYRALIASFFVLTSATRSEEAKPIVWPSGVEVKIDEAIVIKKEAFKKNSAMRDPGGPSAAAFAKCLDDIATSLASERLETELRKYEGSDLKAKIALWALDRKQHPDEYTRIAQGYVDKPVPRRETPDGPVIRKPSPRILRPRTVQPSDLNEEHRLVLEHAYFAPPSGKAFDDNDGARGMVADALRLIGDPRSVIVLREDLAMQMQAWPPDRAGRIVNNGAASIPALWRYRSAESFPVLAHYWDAPPIRARIQDAFTVEFRKTYQPELYADQKEVCDTWQTLADRDWTTESEKAFAAYIKALPPLVKP